MSSPAPIALFAYNRPSHVRMLLESLEKNPLHEQSELFIFCDGPKKDADEKTLHAIAEVRKIVREKKWCSSVHITEAQVNKGLADSIVSGVTEVLKTNDSVIVLEDDLILSPFFLKYMNEALNIYAADERVMHISGYVYPVSGKLPPTFFLGITTCWGWATWKRAWKHFNPSSKILLEQIQQSGRINQFSFNNAGPFLLHLQSNAMGTLKTWAIKWQASVFLKYGLSLHPFPTLVKNTGNDGSGEHSDETDVYQQQKLADEIKISKVDIVESEEARKLVERFYTQIRNKKSLLQRIVGRLDKITKKI